MSRRTIASGGTSTATISSAQSHDTTQRQVSHSRAAQGGSGANTELRAMIRREREMERARGLSAASKENEAPGRRVPSHTGSGISTSLSDRKLTQNSSNASMASSGHGAEDLDGNLNSRKVASRMAAAPVAHSNSSNAAGKKNGVLSLPTSDREDAAPPMNKIPAPPESFDHSFGIDALQAAFSAKYYELANKCKNWEKYAAKLRAQSEALEIENRVLREQNAHLEAEIEDLKDERRARASERYRVEIESRISTLEDRISHKSRSGGDLDDQYRSGETLIDLDRISAPSAPSSAEKSTVSRQLSSVAYCSSNLQVEDRPELRPPTPVSALSLPAQLPGIPSHELHHRSSNEGRRSLSHARDGPHGWQASNKRDSASLAEIINQDASHRDMAALYGEGRSSRLGARTIENDALMNAPPNRAGGIPASATFPPGPNSLASDRSALTSQALAAMNRQHAAMLRQQPQRPLSPGRSGRSSQQGHYPEQSSSRLMMPQQSKRRSTISGERTFELNPATLGVGIHSGAGLLASQGQDPRIRGASGYSDAPTVVGDYLQEYVEQRRQLRRTSFTAQQQMMAVGAGASASGSRPASRLSNASNGGDRTRRARSRAGSVHDAIPVLKDDVFNEGSTLMQGAGQQETSPLLDNTRVMNAAHPLATGRTSPSPESKERRELMETRRQQVSDASQSSSASITSGIADYTSSSNELLDESEDHRRAHRRLYSSLRNELDTDDLIKFEKYVHRYDALEIPLDGPKGLINRVKKLLLLTDPDLKSKPEKLRRRKDLARQFEKVVRDSVVA